MLKELEEGVQKVKKTTCEQNRNIKEIENQKRNQKEILKLKSIITKIRNSLERFRENLIREEERISELEGRRIEIIESKKQKIKIFGGQRT